MVELLDYAGALGRAQGLVPDYAQQQLQKRVADMQLQSQGLQNQQTQQALATDQRNQADDLAFQDDFGNFLKNPTAEGRAQLIGRHPRRAEQAKTAFNAMDSATQAANLRDMSAIYGLSVSGKADVAAQQLKARLDAEKAAGKEPSAVDQALYEQLSSGDPAHIKQAQGLMAYQLSSIVGENKFGSTFTAIREGAPGVKGQIVGRAIGHYDENGKFGVDYRDPDAPQYRDLEVVGPDGVARKSIVSVGGGAGGGDQSLGDRSRLINNDAGGGYVPEGVKTLGQFVNFGKSLNAKGAKSSSAGTYQINGSTMAEFAPQALGKDWRTAPFDATSQEKVGKTIFDWAKTQSNPAAALRGRWVSLTPQEAGQLVQGDWSQARGLIAQKESGGSTPSQGGGGANVVAVGAPTAKPTRMTPQQVAAEGLDPKIAYYRDTNGVPQVVGGQSRPTRQALQLTESQSKATGLLGAAVAAQNSLNTVKGYNPTYVSTALSQLSAGNPIKGELSQTDRRVMNAQLALANAILRLESGAAISPKETAAKAQVLFPNPGDGPDVQADKRAQREAAISALRAAAGPGSENVKQVVANPADKKRQGGALNPISVSSIQQANALPAGTFYRAPDGQVRRR